MFVSVDFLSLNNDQREDSALCRRKIPYKIILQSTSASYQEYIYVWIRGRNIEIILKRFYNSRSDYDSFSVYLTTGITKRFKSTHQGLPQIVLSYF